jgi:hypothetical protein
MAAPQMKSPFSAKDDQLLMTELWDPQLCDDLEKWIMFVYPWGKSGTPLASFKGPRSWQRDEAQAITDHIKKQKEKMLLGLPPEMYQSATASGRGPGKSAFVSMLEHWMMSSRLGSSTIITANTEQQLKSRTWAEVGKWHTMAINSHWFEKMALSVKPTDAYKHLLETQLKVDCGYYYAMAQLWSEENPDAFAGVHNMNGLLLIFDEASGIPRNIWTVSEGFFTEPVLDRYWFVFSNPRRNTGEFYECFHKMREYWHRRNIDSRTVEGTDTAKLNQIVAKYGEDSDEARIEVKGQFPRQGDSQFISREFIENATVRDLERDDYAALVMGVDPARFGDDSTVITFRQGRNYRDVPKTVKLKGKDNMEVANMCAGLIRQYNPDAVCIDAGNGTGIIDRLREMKFKVHEVWFGSKPTEEQWADKRTELWANMREWLGGACIPPDSDLIDDMAGPQYKFVGAGDKIRLESKEEMKKRGLASPDHADALACTFAIKVARKDFHAYSQKSRPRVVRDVDYKIF